MAQDRASDSPCVMTCSNIGMSVWHGVRYILCGEDREWPELDLHVSDCLRVWNYKIGDWVCPMSGLLATEFAEAYLRSIRRNLSEFSLSGSFTGPVVMCDFSGIGASLCKLV